MNKNTCLAELKSIIKSQDLNKRLQQIALNYPNLKQELHIRNAILEIFNSRQKPDDPEAKAVAEQRIKEKRVDLCFVKKKDRQNPFKIELKFQFSKDFKRFEMYRSTIDKDFEKRESDVFLLIVANWDKKEKAEFDKEWNITPNLNQYICNNEPTDIVLWKNNLVEHFKTFEEADLEIINHHTSRPYPVKYYFYLLARKIKEANTVNRKMVQQDVI